MYRPTKRGGAALAEQTDEWHTLPRAVNRILRGSRPTTSNVTSATPTSGGVAAARTADTGRSQT